MILRAKQNGEVLVFELEGFLDFETTREFKSTCSDLMKTADNQRIIFNMEKLKFVGSSSINQFIQIMKEFNSPKFIKPKPRLCNLSKEFQRIFRAYQTTRNPFEICESENEAVVSFDAPPKKRGGKKKKTLEN